MAFNAILVGARGLLGALASGPQAPDEKPLLYRKLPTPTNPGPSQPLHLRRPNLIDLHSLAVELLELLELIFGKES
ncbi:hypothetical protein MGG_16529 [Pyricularia oryzae 70-15]|uniref:Uncharacterized protein n=3 Tax=Pyricularia oryzae TaxID=318829 RepID=G4MKL6_PYRO7|nr:uncharacterized protein MGG_16529 [Pyricularia oryzae 70-15]EHA58399.1 hypothetical protein MGG_16529 [Pyricularia oryzae 70-15]ELQ44731.1 hypothetical protein OOU_Y34scaffold00058g4 [Pyricularia oryzae Y34]